MNSTVPIIAIVACERIDVSCGGWVQCAVLPCMCGNHVILTEEWQWILTSLPPYFVMDRIRSDTKSTS